MGDIVQQIFLPAAASIIGGIIVALYTNYQNKVNEKRLKSEMVAELLAQWIKKDYDVDELNRLTFKTFIWLPEELAKKLSNLLAHKEVLYNGEEINVRTLIYEVRKIIHGKKDGLDKNDIIIFPKQSE